MPQSLLKQRQPQPMWMQKAASISAIAEIKRDERHAATFDENYHEYEDPIDEKSLCNSFIVNDPGQCIDKRETKEEESTHAMTILDDLEEDKPKRKPSTPHAGRERSPYTKMSTLTLKHLALNGDKRAEHALSFRSGSLASRLGIEMLFEYGEMQPNGNLLVKTGWAGNEEATYYREQMNL